MENIDLTKDINHDLVNSISRLVKSSLHRFACIKTRKSKRSKKNEVIKNFTIDKSIAQPILNDLIDIPTYTGDDNDNYRFSRAAFYKCLAGYLKSKGISSERSKFYGGLKGPVSDRLDFYQMLCPDFINGPITNQSLHVYMSDLSRTDYHNFIKEIYSSNSNLKSLDEIDIGTYVLRTLINTMENNYEESFKIQNKDYTLKTLPLHLLSYLTKTPINTDVLSTSMLTDLESAVHHRFSAKFVKLIENCHLSYVIDTVTGEISKSDKTSVKIEFNNKSRIIYVDDLKNQILISGFELGTANSFKKIFNISETEFTIPEGMTHVFISCKNANCCTCNKSKEMTEDTLNDNTKFSTSAAAAADTVPEIIESVITNEENRLETDE